MRNRIQSGGLEITNCCNLKCIHCYLGDSCEKPIFMDYDRIIFFINQFIKYKARHVIISGGEPLLHPDIELLIQDFGTRYSETQFIITTNGSFLDDHIVDVLRLFKNIQIQISLDGAIKETHERQHGINTFDNIIKALDYMIDLPRERKILHMTISQINYKECTQVAELASRFNTLVNYTYVCKVGNAAQNWDKLKMTLAQQIYANETVLRYARSHLDQNIRAPRSILKCPFEFTDYIFGVDIHPNGDVDICTCLDGEYIIGNAYLDNFETFLNSPKIDSLAERIIERKSVLRETKCKGCSALNRCNQGCIGRAQSLGNEFGLDDQCDYRKALQFKNLFFYAEKKQ